VSSLDLFCHKKTAVTFARWRLLLSSFRVFCLRHHPGCLYQTSGLFFPCVHCSDILMRQRSLYFLCQLFLLAILRVPATICWVGSVLLLCACAAFCFRHPVAAVAARSFSPAAMFSPTSPLCLRYSPTWVLSEAGGSFPSSLLTLRKSFFCAGLSHCGKTMRAKTQPGGRLILWKCYS
jgi:hypothetical protein